jgi:hypothetical protein
MAVVNRANSDYGRFVDEVKDMSLFPLSERTGGLRPGSTADSELELFSYSDRAGHEPLGYWREEVV